MHFIDQLCCAAAVLLFSGSLERLKELQLKARCGAMLISPHLSAGIQIVGVRSGVGTRWL
jgi:hypothetical protein